MTAETTWAELQEVIDRLVAQNLADCEAMLRDDLDLSDTDLQRVMTQTAPLIRAQTRHALETGWRSLQH